MISMFKFSKLRRLHKLSYSITRCAKECHVDRKTAAKYIKDLDAYPQAAKAPRTYVTRKTDFDKFWPEIQAMLENENRLKPYSILEHMIEKHKEDFDPKWQKTLERRIARWRIANGIEKEVFFPQIHKPGDVLAIDFQLGVCRVLSVGVLRSTCQRRPKCFSFDRWRNGSHSFRFDDSVRSPEENGDCESLHDTSKIISTSVCCCVETAILRASPSGESS